MSLQLYFLYAVALVALTGQTQQSLNILVKIKDIKSGKFLGVNTTKGGANLVYAEKGLKYYDWILEPNCHSDSKKPSYLLRLANNMNFRWNHRRGCQFNDADLVIYNKGSETGFNNYFVYDSELRTIQVCGDNCIFVEPKSKKVKSSKECTKKCIHNKFDILFQELREPTSTSSLNLDCFN
ncbi:uncharacterized protein [Diabrotica undecimpunctata]|uniref:uncharacterized protein isoform X2 n=1 Tax=Diabrotica undecimpunctata TaxID=50387 RepID=UPI003B63EE88